MDLWSDDPTERLKAARDPQLVRGLAERIVSQSRPPQTPWPYGMSCAVNPYVVFLGPSSGNSPVSGDPDFLSRRPNDMPTAGVPVRGLDGSYNDPRRYFEKIRKLGVRIIQSLAPSMTSKDATGLLGQLNLSTSAHGKAREVVLDPSYCRWVPEVLIEHLRPAFVVMLGLSSILKGDGGRLLATGGKVSVDWKKPEVQFPFMACTDTQYSYRIWKRLRSDGKSILFVQWPQHPGKPPMTIDGIWQRSAEEFAAWISSPDGIRVRSNTA